MSDLPPATTASANQPAQLTPSFFRALGGVWLFTWKSNLALGRLPGLLVTLFALPVVVCLTTLTAESWSRRHAVMGNPGLKVTQFSGRLARAGVPLQPQQQAELDRIFREEFSRAERELTADSPNGVSVNRQKEAIQDCYARVQDRCRSLLDERQFAEYVAFEQRMVDLSEGHVRERRWSRTEPFYRWLIDFYFFVILPLNCVRACGGLIRDEVQADTLGFLTTRPLTRARLLILKFFSQVAWVQILMLVEALLLFAVGVLRRVPNLGTLLPLFLLAQFLAVFAWGALGIFLGQATKRYMAAAMLYGLVVEMGIGRIPTNINNLSLMRHFKALLGHNSALQAVYDWSLEAVPYSAGAIVLAGCIFLALAAVLFTLLEYQHTAEMQK